MPRFTAVLTLVIVLSWEHSLSAALTTFSTQAAFSAAAPGIASQTFGIAFGELAMGSGDTMAGPLNSSTNNIIFKPGDILPGLAISSSIPGSDSLFISDALGSDPLHNELPNINNRTVVTNNEFIASLNLSFSPGVTAVGLGLVSEFSNSNLQLSVFGATNNLLGTLLVTNVPSSGPSKFFGITTSGETISRVNINSATNQAEGVDLVQFGQAAATSAVPEPASLILWGLTGVCCMIGRHRGGRGSKIVTFWF